MKSYTNLLQSLMVLCLCTFFSSCKSSIGVTSYNIFHGEMGFEEGKSSVLKLKKDLKGDVMFLQEVDSMTQRSAGLNQGQAIHVLEILADNKNYRFKKAIDFGGGGYGIGLISKQPIQEIAFQLPQIQKAEPRVALGTVYRLNKKQEVLVLGTHLCHLSTENRLAQLKAIVNFVQSRNRPCILGGDFNFSPNSEEYVYLTQFFEDAGKHKNELTFPANKPSERIDFLFLSKEHRWKIKEFKTGKTVVSDHLPIFGRFKL